MSALAHTLADLSDAALALASIALAAGLILLLGACAVWLFEWWNEERDS